MKPGETGVFTLNGKDCVKELGNGVLTSLNPDDDPIPITEPFNPNRHVIGVLNSGRLRDKLN